MTLVAKPHTSRSFTTAKDKVLVAIKELSESRRNVRASRVGGIRLLITYHSGSNGFSAGDRDAVAVGASEFARYSREVTKDVGRDKWMGDHDTNRTCMIFPHHYLAGRDPEMNLHDVVW